MRRRWIESAFIGMGLLIAGGLAVQAVGRDREKKEDEQKITLEQVPGPAREALTKLAGGAAITKVEKEDENGEEVYEATWTADGKKHEAKVKKDGTPVIEEDEQDEDQAGKEVEAQEEAEEAAEAAKLLPLTKITLAQAIEIAIKEVKGGKAFAAALEDEDGQPRYEVKLMAGDKCSEVEVDGITGKVLEVEAKDQPAVQANGWRDSFPVDKANLVPTGRGPYFILEPGHKAVYQDKKVTLTITVLDETKVVDGVTTRVVEEREEKSGQPLEISRNYVAIDKNTKDVYYFGEDVDEYKNGQIASHEGAWLAGVKNAKFGLMMPGNPKVGDKFYQELAPKAAMDRAEIVSLDEEIKTPAGTFKCVHVKETSPLERGVSHKWYAPGVGLIKDDGSVLVKTEKP
jgi:uncharacterized membrane protein YkoI